MNLTHVQPLQSGTTLLNGVAATISGTGLPANGSITSLPIRVPYSGGNACMFLKTSGNESITVQMQASFNGKNFHEPIDQDGTSLQNVYNGSFTGSTGKFVSFSPVPAEFLRFRILANDNATVTATYIGQEVT